MMRRWILAFATILILLSVGTYGCTSNGSGAQLSKLSPSGVPSASGLAPLPGGITLGDYSIAIKSVDRREGYLPGVGGYEGTIWLALRRVRTSSDPWPRRGGTAIRLIDDHGNDYGDPSLEWEDFLIQPVRWPSDVSPEQVPLGFTWVVPIRLRTRGSKIPSAAPLVRWEMVERHFETGGISDEWHASTFKELPVSTNLSSRLPSDSIISSGQRMRDPTSKWISVVFEGVRTEGSALVLSLKIENDDYNTKHWELILGLQLADGTLTWKEGHFPPPGGWQGASRNTLSADVPGNTYKSLEFRFPEGAVSRPRPTAILVAFDDGLRIYKLEGVTSLAPSPSVPPAEAILGRWELVQGRWAWDESMTGLELRGGGAMILNSGTGSHMGTYVILDDRRLEMDFPSPKTFKNVNQVFEFTMANDTLTLPRVGTFKLVFRRVK